MSVIAGGDIALLLSCPLNILNIELSIQLDMRILEV